MVFGGLPNGMTEALIPESLFPAVTAAFLLLTINIVHRNAKRCPSRLSSLEHIFTYTHCVAAALPGSQDQLFLLRW